MTVDAVDVVPARTIAVEVEVVRGVLAVLVERGRPVEAVVASVVELRVQAVARSRKKYSPTVRAREFSSSHTVLRCPF